MKTLASNLLGVIMGSIIVLIILLTSVQLVAFSKPYYQWHFKHYNIMKDTKMSYDDLMMVTNEMLKYLNNQRDDLKMDATIAGQVEEVFGTRERLHMEDVKVLFVIAKYFRNISSFLIFIVLLIVWRLRKELLVKLLVKIQYVIISFLGLMILLGIIISTNFNYYFELFHKIFFSNDLWLLDPSTDILINLVPLSFFINTAILILIIFLILSTTSIIAIQITKVKNRAIT